MITSFLPTTGNGLGGGANLANNVLYVKYSSTFTYINANSIPAYKIGGSTGTWANSATASAKNYIFKIPRAPAPAASKTEMISASPAISRVGVLIDGTSVYTAWDGSAAVTSSESPAVSWHRNSYFSEKANYDNGGVDTTANGVTTITCNGHPFTNNEYHFHVNPRCLYTASSTTHSPLLGFAFDGYPIYGPYAYATTTGTGGITRMRSSYAAKASYAGNKRSNAASPGASDTALNDFTNNPIGAFIQDYVYTAGSGDLDEFNGRTAVTPEYPSGTYAYYVTIDTNGAPAYPYIVGPKFYGTPELADTAATPSTTTISETVTTYYSST